MGVCYSRNDRVTEGARANTERTCNDAKSRDVHITKLEKKLEAAIAAKADQEKRCKMLEERLNLVEKTVLEIPSKSDSKGESPPSEKRSDLQSMIKELKAELEESKAVAEKHRVTMLLEQQKLSKCLEDLSAQIAESKESNLKVPDLEKEIKAAASLARAQACRLALLSDKVSQLEGSNSQQTSQPRLSGVADVAYFACMSDVQRNGLSNKMSLNLPEGRFERTESPLSLLSDDGLD